MFEYRKRQSLACSLPRFRYAQFVALTVDWQEYNVLKRSLQIMHDDMSVLQYVRCLAAFARSHLPGFHGECVTLFAVLSCSLPYQHMANGMAHRKLWCVQHLTMFHSLYCSLRRLFACCPIPSNMCHDRGSDASQSLDVCIRRQQQPLVMPHQDFFKYGLTCMLCAGCCVRFTKSMRPTSS